MRVFLNLLMALPLLAAQPEPFRLQPGEFRWIPITVRQTPTEIDCRFQVVAGQPSVRVELLAIRDFHRFNRGLPHESLALLPVSREGAFRRMMDVPGQYALVVVNAKNSPAAAVVLDVSTDVNPAPRVVARELPPGRRLIVILISFAIFFVTVTWSGIQLLKATSS